MEGKNQPTNQNKQRIHIRYTYTAVNSLFSGDHTVVVNSGHKKLLRPEEKDRSYSSKTKLNLFIEKLTHCHTVRATMWKHQKATEILMQQAFTCSMERNAVVGRISFLRFKEAK